MTVAAPSMERESIMAAENAEPGTRTVRIAGHAVKKLQMISSMKDLMGQKFRPIEFLNGLVERPIDELYDETYAAFQETQKKGKRK